MNNQIDGRLFKIYQATPYLSIKHSSYFQVYESLLERFVDQAITFVEIGVLNGGSLAMWRTYLGPRARIIGIDMNPAAKRWETAGFEIFIGDQSAPEFWRNFGQQVGNVDVLLDDGGHTNAQQTVTLNCGVPLVRDGGLVIIEDTHCSYFTEFGNPSKYSFINHAKRLVDQINSRHPGVQAGNSRLATAVASIRFFESIVAFEVDRRLCSAPVPTSNGGVSVDAKDFRYVGRMASRIQALEMRVKPLSRWPLLWRIQRLFPRLLGVLAWVESRRVFNSLKG
jgi:hypothetical protein